MEKKFGPSLLPGTPKEHSMRPSPGGPEGERPPSGAAAVIPPLSLTGLVIPLPQPAGSILPKHLAGLWGNPPGALGHLFLSGCQAGAAILEGNHG